MTKNELIFDTHRYREVRGWAPRRVYMTLPQLRRLRVDEPGAYFDPPVSSKTHFMFDGVTIRHVRSTTVAALIREWDLQP